MTNVTVNSLENILYKTIDSVLSQKTLISGSEVDNFSYSRDIMIPALKQEMKEHLVITAGMLAIANPIYAFAEQPLQGFGVDSTIGFRITGSLMALAGVGYVYNLGRDKFNEIIDGFKEKIDFNLDKKNMWIRDHFYSSVFGFGFTYGIYMNSGNMLSNDILDGAVVGAIISAFAGGPIGYGMCAMKEIIGIGEPQQKRLSEKPKEPESFFERMFYPVNVRLNEWYESNNIENMNIFDRIKIGTKILAGSTAITTGLILSVPEKYEGIFRFSEVVKSVIDYF